MLNADQKMLKALLNKFKESYPNYQESEIFELFCADVILRKYDLDNDEISSGILDGQDDGAIDAGYLICDQLLVREDFKFSSIKRKNPSLELIIIQSKLASSFAENVIEKLNSSIPAFLNQDSTIKFKPEVDALSQLYSCALTSLVSQMPEISVSIYYCCNARSEPNHKIKAKISQLKESIKNNVPRDAKVEVELLGAADLYSYAQNKSTLVKTLRPAMTPIFGHEESTISLCSLSNFLNFISADDDNIELKMFDANVRSYQGEVEVNKEIAQSLINPKSGVDFWWLNNGVTIVADSSQFIRGELSIINPLIVNGLQTSFTLFHNRKSLSKIDEGKILVKVVIPADEADRDQIIRATNRQTAIKTSSFRATEPVHKKIEDFLLLSDIYYDRQKNFYKNLGKRNDRIITIDRMAQSCLTLLQNKPHVATGKPSSILKKDEDYQRLFPSSASEPTYSLEFYRNIALLIVDLDQYIKKSERNKKSALKNLKFHILMVIGWILNGGKTLHPQGWQKLDKQYLTDKILIQATE